MSNNGLHCILHRHAKRGGYNYWQVAVFPDRIEIRWGPVGRDKKPKVTRTLDLHQALELARKHRDRKMNETIGHTGNQKYWKVEDTLPERGDQLFSGLDEPTLKSPTVKKTAKQNSKPEKELTPAAKAYRKMCQQATW